ncbi:SpoIIE family protein phosphatase [Streptomyces sp. CC210A]|uniref:SpoIIE family protein phosphatase n=1 Tax=Streptomyces sp. CC210A TaxID=2898184 RepID=UPI001F261BD3|nr:SpoIIE family protein phosphatase [Streptomyces sp. CC210A]
MDGHESTSEVRNQPPGPAAGRASVLRELLPIALWRTDADGRVVEWSPAAGAVLGHPPDSVLGREVLSRLITGTDRPLAERLARRALAGQSVVGTLSVRHRDGRPVPMEMWISPVADPQGGTGLLTVAVETSAVGAMRDALAALEGLFTQSPIGLATLGPDLRFLRVNDALARMNGVPAEAHLGRRLTEVAPGVNADVLERAMQRVLDRGEPMVDVRRTGRTPADPDHDRTWSCSYAPLLDGSGRRLGVIASLIDVTEKQEAQAEAERARQRFALLAEAATRIGTTLDLRRTAEEVVEVLVPRLGDSADVQLLEAVLHPDETTASTRGVVRRVAAEFRYPALPPDDLAVGLTYQVPLGSVYERVIAEGRSMNLYLADIPALFSGPDSERLRAYLREQVGCARLVPLVARGTVLGAVVVTRTRRREPFDAQDHVVIDELAARAALNIDNARLYTAQREAALTLQRSLATGALPEVAGLELAGRYLPASDHEVGGDWFDVIPLPGGRTGLVIGDVMGHGIHAAAVMGQLRTAVRTLARQDLPPAALLAALDAAVADLGEDEMATCVYAVHDPAAGSCVVARAGHPPPAVVHAEGRVTYLDGSPGTPLGAGGHHFTAERIDLPSNCLLVLYTDGLVEARDRDWDEGLQRLSRALRDLDRPLDDICDGVLGRMLPAAAQDDVAVLLARTAGPPGAPAPDPSRTPTATRGRCPAEGPAGTEEGAPRWTSP